jgi:protein phosphatase 1 regulatory subunit 7
MKNKVIYVAFAIFAIVSCTKDTEIEIPTPIDEFVEIPDVNFERELVLQGIDSDGIINHRILKTDVEKVSKLSLYSKGIGSLKGIESFKNLKRLYADANSLKTIDVSNNVLLDTISLTSNDLTEIEGLEKAKNLTWLSLSSNYFTEFTLDNDNVKNFLMDHNDLVSLEIKNAPKLESAILNINEIQSLDFSNSPLLKVLNFSANKVKTINFSSNLNLEYIWCSSNLFKDFDLSMLPNLIDVRVDRNPTLTCIKVAAGQQIPTLKLSTYQTANVNCN